MAYCTSAEVQAEFKKITFDTNSAIASSTVDRFISEIDAYINGRLSLKYQVPVTSTEALKIVKAISVALVKKRINEILEVKTPNDAANQGGQRPLKYTSEYDPIKMLDHIVSGDLALTDATLASSDDGVKSYVSSNNIERTFQVDTDQW